MINCNWFSQYNKNNKVGFFHSYSGHQRWLHTIKTLVIVLCLWNSGIDFHAHTACAKKAKSEKKEDKKQGDSPLSAYKKLTGNDSISTKDLVNVIKKDNDYYFDIPKNLLGRELLVSNKLLKVPSELNEAGVNKGINYENKTIRLEWERKLGKLNIREQRLTPEVYSFHAMAPSVADNYINPLIASLKVEAVGKDSTSLVVKVTDLFNGNDNCINDVFNLINLGTSVSRELSRILDVKAFESNVAATSELTTVVHEGKSKTNITIVVSTSLILLPERPMQGRLENQKVGYFTTNVLKYGDYQPEVERKNYITRWRLEPSDTTAYMRGELVEPLKPITFYIDKAVPRKLMPYIKQGMLDWNKAFERAGFKNAVRVLEYTDSMEAEGDNVKYSVLTYDASEKANAMGPSVIDPRTGEILKADVIWWHNVRSLLKEWIMVQTSAYNKNARQPVLPDSLLGDAARFVACHEVGHSLGLRHNMRASNAYPTDSLRSLSFTNKIGGTSASIMDYARFNYVAQPHDNIKVISPNIGPYDLMAIEWGYRWYPSEVKARTYLHQFLAQHKDKQYQYSEAQSQRTAIDPRSLSEDLGDDAVKSARYGIANLKRVMPNVIKWTTTGAVDQTYEEASKLYNGIIFQWSLYSYHALANVGGMYIENTTVGDGQRTFSFVPKQKQKEAVKFILDEVLTAQPWLFNNDISHYTFLNKTTPIGVQEVVPSYSETNQQSYILWDILDNSRLVRMLENERQNGANKAFTVIELMDMLHQHIFKTTINNQMPNIAQRALQKNFIDALITAAAESEGVKINKKLNDSGFILNDPRFALSCKDLSSAPRMIEFTGTQATRISDAISVKRGELIRVLKLLKSKTNVASTAVRLHYDDVILRIQTALGLNK